MTDWNAVSAFMANVVAWPAVPTDPGYVNLHYSSIDRKNPTGPLRKGMGKPFRSVDTFVSYAGWINGQTQFKDVWYCLSLQSQTKTNAKFPTKPFAHRLAANALKVKAIWVDVDVGPEAKKYPTIEEALKALIKFRETVGLPPFSALVASGGGLHAYWISDVALTVREWAPYAEGLKQQLLAHGVKCDAGITTDVARILRVPGTFNHKTTPPKPVNLLNVPLVMYDFPTSLGFIQAQPTGPQPGPAAPAHSVFADDAAAARFAGAKAIFTIAGPDLQAGIDKHEDKLLEVAPIFHQCGFYKDALLTGGKDFDNALWMYSVLGTTFMENGNAIAHAISQGHATYTADGTQALYDRKVADRADRGIGYPSCSAIASAGCKSCATCPLFAKGKSPLNIRPAVTAAVNPLNMALPLAQTQQAQAMNLPEGYDLDDNGIICEVVQNEVNGELMPPTLYPLFFSKLSDPWVQKDPDSLNFTTTRDKGSPPYHATIKLSEMNAMNLSGVYGAQNVKIYPKNKARLEHFTMAWISKLHEVAAAQQSLPFGWFKEAGATKGFVYAGKLMRDDGSEVPCGVGDPKMRKIFHPSGDIADWFKACSTITGQKRPELDAIIALSFAAPLTALIGQNAMTLCAYGESGAGKTAAYSAGVSVWGHSKYGKQVSHSTFNAVMKVMGELANLPLYWDEIKDPKAQKAVYDFIYNATDGVEKSRMKADTSLQTQGIWQTQMMMAANISFVDFVMKQNPSHVAGVSRVLEYYVKRVETGPGRISPADAALIFDKLSHSYGNVGLLYSKLLALNHVQIAADTLAEVKQVETIMQVTAEERLWSAQVGTLIQGAKLANTLGCEFDVDALRDFLYQVFRDNRAKRNTMMNVSGTRETTEGIMSAYFAQVMAADQSIWTEGMPKGPGNVITPILRGPKDSKNTAVTTNVAVRWDVVGKTLYILRDHLVDYLTEKGVGVSTCFKSLEVEYGMSVQRRVRLAGGTSFYSGRSTVCVIPNVGPQHDFADLMFSPLPANQRPAEDAPLAPVEPVDTGFEETVSG